MKSPRRARLLTLLLIVGAGAVVTVLSTSWETAPDGPVGSQEPPAPAAPRTVDLGPEQERSLDVFVQRPSSLLPGRSRQVRVSVVERPPRAGQQASDLDQLLEVELSLEPTQAAAGALYLEPRRTLVRRGELHWTRFELGALDGIDCDAELGDLRVSVREIADDGASGETVVALPSVDCRDQPSGPPDALHVTDPVCGSDWREDVEAISDGEEPPPEEACERFDDDGEPLPVEPPPRTRTFGNDRAPGSNGEDPDEEPPAEETDEQSEEPPAEESEAPEADEEPAEEPAEQPAEEPAEQPAEEPAEQPAEEPEAPEESGSEAPPEEPAEEEPAGDEPPDESSEEPTEDAGEAAEQPAEDEETNEGSGEE